MDTLPPSHEQINWAPKIRQAKIWQLYQNDARGTVDEDLVGDVGYRLLQRCRSIQLATNRSLECPRCGAVFNPLRANLGDCFRAHKRALNPAVAGRQLQKSGISPGVTVTCWDWQLCPPSKITCAITHTQPLPRDGCCASTSLSTNSTFL